MKCAVSLSTSSSGEEVRYWQYPRLATTSQKCACCGHTAKENRPSQSQFECLECGYTANADINGARNILAAGHAVLASGGEGAVRPPVEAGTRRGDSDISLNAVGIHVL